MKDGILELLKDPEYIYRTVDLLAKELGHQKSDQFVKLVKTLNQLEDEGLVVRDKYNNYYLPEQLNIYVGVLSLNKRGYGFVKTDRLEKDIFIGKNDLKGAFNQDTVLVELAKKSDGDSPEGKIVKIINRGQTRFVGEVKKAKRDFYVDVDDVLFDQPIFVDQAHSHGAMPGHKVMVEIKTYKPFLKGDIIKILGHRNDPGIDILSVVYQHDTRVDFPQEVFDQISDIPSTIKDVDISDRLDLRNEVIVTIDGEDAKDLDDAISLKKLDNGHYYLGVHIADVSYYVTEGSPLDKEAFNRGTSIYLVDRVIPMLPHKLSNGICSLNPHEDRLTISCFMEIDQEGNVVDHEIVPSVINSTERMTYTNVNHILANNQALQLRYSHVKDLFFRMFELAQILRKKRFDRGAIDFDVKEAKVLVDNRGNPTDVVVRNRGEAEKIIEEFMLLANETVAQHFYWLELPFIYRVHENPKPEKLLQFVNIAKTMGYTIKGSLENIYPSELSTIIEASKGTPEHTIIATLLLRCMQKARYDEQCLGHFGLADEFYTHFTSPIRRYPDLIVHRMIRRFLFDKQLDKKTIRYYQDLMMEIAEQSSFRERVAIEIEREVDDMKMAEYMEKHLGEEFEGTISSITNFGFFVELDNTIDGLVHVTDLTDDFYFFDERNLRYIGQRNRKVFKMSDRVKVRVASASKKDRSIDFEIVGMKSNKKPRKTVIINKQDDQGKKKRSKRDNRFKKRHEEPQFFNKHRQNRKRRSRKRR
ncbi:MAG: ribonuclease R [Thomasclavelia sp.]